MIDRTESRKAYTRLFDVIDEMMNKGLPQELEARVIDIQQTGKLIARVAYRTNSSTTHDRMVEDIKSLVTRIERIAAIHEIDISEISSTNEARACIPEDYYNLNDGDSPSDIW